MIIKLLLVSLFFFNLNLFAKRYNEDTPNSLSLTYSPAFYRLQSNGGYMDTYAQLVGLRYTCLDYQDIRLGTNLTTGKFQTKLSADQTTTNIFGAGVTLGKEVYDDFWVSFVMGYETFSISEPHKTTTYNCSSYGILLEKEIDLGRNLKLTPYGEFDYQIYSGDKVFSERILIGISIGVYF